jgi:hypothetical protein
MSAQDNFQERLRQQVCDMDCETTDGAKLLFDHLDAVKRLNSLLNDFEFLADARRKIGPDKRSDKWALWLDATERVYDLYQYFCAVAKATANEIFKRAERNGTNRNFAYLKMGHDTNNSDLVNDAYRQLEKLLLSIPWKKVWRHPDGPEEWRSTVNILLAKELEKRVKQDRVTTFADMLNNRFAYIYTAAECAFKDELRKLYRRPAMVPGLRVALDEISEVMMAAPPVEERELERLFMVKFIEMEGCRATRTAEGVILREAARVLKEDPDSLVQNTSRQIRADLVKAVARETGKSERQVRNDIRTLEADEDNKYLNLRREMLRTSCRSTSVNEGGRPASSTSDSAE